MLGSHELLLPSPGDVRYDEAMGYPMVQQWRVRSNLYRVKLSTITLSAGEDCRPQPGDLAWFSSGLPRMLALEMLRE